MTLFPPPLAAASPLSITKKLQSVIIPSRVVSRLLPYLAISATRIIHLLGWENKRSDRISKIFFLFRPKMNYKLSLRVTFSNTFDNL